MNIKRYFAKAWRLWTTRIQRRKRFRQLELNLNLWPKRR